MSRKRVNKKESRFRNEKSASKRNSRVDCTIDQTLFKELERLRQANGWSRSETAAAAIKAFVYDELEVPQLFKHLNQVKKRLQKLEAQNLILYEMLYLFISYYFTLTPQVPEGGKEQAKLKGDVMRGKFVKALKGSLGKGGLLSEELKELLEDK